MSLVTLLCILLYILLCNVEGWSTSLFSLSHNTFNSIVSYIYLLVISRSRIRMSTRTSDSTIIPSTRIEAHNLRTTVASAAPRDGSSPVTIPTTIPENRQ